MTEKVEHRARSRDRDQRMPTFQVLDHFHHNGLHPEAKHTEPHPHPHSSRKTSKSPTAARHDHTHLPVGRPRNNKDSPPTTARKSPVSSRFSSPSPNRRHELVSSNETVHGSGGSRQSIGSGRGPACSFADQFYLHSSQRSRSFSPKRGNTCGSPERKNNRREDEGGAEEATDVLVWNTTKKSSRTNILCPLTDSERLVMNKQEGRKGSRGRSTSLPSSKRQQPCRGFSRSLLSLDDTCQTELIDNFLPPTLHEASSSVSFASSSNDYEIAMVTQQLEQIQQAQNNILKQLGDEIAVVHTENERLRKEVELVREQNEKLHNLIKDMSGQLERMKQIFRTRGLPIPPSAEHIAASVEKTKKAVEDAPPTSLALKSDSSTSADDKLLPLAEPPQEHRHKRRSHSRSKSPSKSKQSSDSSKKPAHDQPESRNKSVKIAQPPHHEVGGQGESPETLEKLLTHHNPKVVEDFKNTRESFLEDGHNFEVEEYNDVVEKLWVEVDTVGAPETRTHRSRDSSAGSNKSHAHSPHREVESKSSKRSRDGKRAGEKTSLSGIRTTESKDFKSDSSIAKSVKVSKRKRRGCFGLFNFFWPSKAYAKDSEDEICE